MNSTHVDRISKAIAQHCVDRRQPATPVADLSAPDAERGPTMLFVQTYQSGSIAPIAGSLGRYTLTLEEGSGQTVYFSDRPDRIVGSESTPIVLEALGFLPDNPPNAALVIETAPGESDVAVVELFSPSYDPMNRTVTYEAGVLANWTSDLDVGFTEAPTDLALLVPTFGNAQLFIDDCADMPMECVDRSNVDGPAIATIDNKEHDGFCYSFAYGACLPCQPWYRQRVDAFTYWTNQCNSRFSDCHGTCVPRSVCSDVIGCR